MNIKNKIFLGTGLVATILAVASFAFVYAAMMNGSDTTKPSSMMMMHPPKPMVLVVSNSGHGLMRGVVETVTANSLTVAGWGGTWTVNVGSDTKLAPSTNLSEIKMGDFVGVTGMVSEDSLTITADRVHDWTTKEMMMKNGQ